jgi:hypothetical protein
MSYMLVYSETSRSQCICVSIQYLTGLNVHMVVLQRFLMMKHFLLLYLEPVLVCKESLCSGRTYFCHSTLFFLV